MPTISLFHGIKITMYYNDHKPPHFHATYAGNTAIVSILDATVLLLHQTVDNLCVQICASTRRA